MVFILSQSDPIAPNPSEAGALATKEHVHLAAFLYREHVSAQLQVAGVSCDVNVGAEVVRDLVEVS